jgi:hypothetical protein
MSDRNKLAVIDTIADAFSFGLKKLPSVLVLYLTVAILIFGPILYLAYPMAIDLIQFFKEIGEDVDPEELAEQIIPFMPVIFLVVVGALFQHAIITPLIIRNITHGETLWLLRINKNTFRYILAAIVIGIFMMLAYFAFAALVAGAAIATDGNQDLQGIIIALSVVIGIILMIYFIVRLSLIPIDIVAQSSFAIGRGYGVSKGNVLRLIGLIIIVMAAMMVIGMIYQVVITILMVAGGIAFLPSDFDAVEQDPALLMEHLMALLTSPIMVIVVVFSIVLDAFQTAVMTSAPVFAYRRLVGATDS